MDSIEQIVKWIRDLAFYAGASSPDDSAQDVIVRYLSSGRDLHDPSILHPCTYWSTAGKRQAIQEHTHGIWKRRGKWMLRGTRRETERSGEPELRLPTIPLSCVPLWWWSGYKVDSCTEEQAIINMELEEVLKIIPNKVLRLVLRGTSTINNPERQALYRWRRNHRRGA